MIKLQFTKNILMLNVILNDTTVKKYNKVLYICFSMLVNTSK